MGARKGRTAAPGPRGGQSTSQISTTARKRDQGDRTARGGFHSVGGHPSPAARRARIVAFASAGRWDLAEAEAGELGWWAA